MSKLKTTLIEKIFKNIKKSFIHWFLILKYNKIKIFLEGIPLNIKSFFQRGKNGWSKKDTWSLDLYLSNVIIQSIFYLKNIQIGVPLNLTSKKWKNILNKIINTFELAKKIINLDLELIRNKKDRIKFKKIFKNKNKCMTEKQIKQYDEGWTLFKKYFFNLWD